MKLRTMGNKASAAASEYFDTSLNFASLHDSRENAIPIAANGVMVPVPPKF